jgi:hypothetical protein
VTRDRALYALGDRARGAQQHHVQLERRLRARRAPVYAGLSSAGSVVVIISFKIIDINRRAIVE